MIVKTVESFIVDQSDVFAGVRVVAAELAGISGVTIFIFECYLNVVCNERSGNSNRAYVNFVIVRVSY